MHDLKFEICLPASLPAEVKTAVNIGASRIELCAGMKYGGITPQPEQISKARQYWKYDSGFLTMIRPRAGNFCYSSAEIRQMKKEIELAAENGSQGIVFGVLNEKSEFCRQTNRDLIHLAKSLKLESTFHRAFDAQPDPAASIPFIVDSGFQRILTSGSVWSGTASAIEGLDNLKKYLQTAKQQIEIVIAGGITTVMAKMIQQILENEGIATNSYFSFHAYSGLRKNGKLLNFKINNNSVSDKIILRIE